MIPKYRAKRIDNNEWVYGMPILCGVSGRCFMFPDGDMVLESDRVGEEGCLRLVTFEVDPATVGQWTGKKDRDGAEIYAGDIFNPVVFRDGSRYNTPQSVCIEDGAISIGMGFFSLLDLVRSCKTGSIHDNPELVKP